METMIPRTYEHAGKRYVEVTVYFREDGKMIPRSFMWHGQSFDVDRLLEVRPEASRIAGAFGMRYICRVLGRQLSLWYEEGRWFVEIRPKERPTMGA